MEIEEYPLGVMLRLICNHLETQANHRLEKHDLTLSQMLIINFLIMHPDRDISQKEIEDRFHLKHSTISGLLQRLEKKNMIVRFSSPEDGRLKYIVPTDKAKEMYESLKDFMSEHDRKITRECSEEELECLNRVLQRLTISCFTEESVVQD